jgi:hypothetical protein
MPFGRPGDHPRTDLLRHGLHPFPPEIERLMREVLEVHPRFPYGGRSQDEQAAWERRMWDWRRGLNIDEGLRALEEALLGLK